MKEPSIIFIACLICLAVGFAFGMFVMFQGWKSWAYEHNAIYYYLDANNTKQWDWSTPAINKPTP